MTFVDVDEVRHLSTHRHQRLLYLPNLGDIQDLYPQSTMSMKKIASTMMQMMANTGAKGAKHDPIPMIYPYSTTAEMIHHPWVYNFKVSWMLRYMCYSALLMYPLLWKITSIVNSPEAKLAWEKKKKDDFIKEHKKEWEI